MTDQPLTNAERVQRCLDEIGTSAVGSYGSLSTAVAVADGLSTRLAWALVKRNEDPDGARENLVGAFAAYEVLKRVMITLEADAPAYAEQGAAQAVPILGIMDRRDQRGARG